MNTLPNPPENTSDDIDLGRLVITIWAGKYKIIFAMAIALGVGLIYLASTPPVYQADALLQLEGRNGRLALPEVMQDFIESDPISVTELEILRSRMVISQVVEDLNLEARAEPVLFPVFGYAFTRFDFSIPEFDALTDYARSTEHIRLDRLKVPSSWLDKPIMLSIYEKGIFRITTPDGAVNNGRVGETLSLENGEFELHISELSGAAGRLFELRKVSKSTAIRQVRSALTVSERGRQSGVLEVRYTSQDRDQATRILNSILETYVRQNIERSAAEAESSLQFIEGQLPEAERTLSQAEVALGNFQQSRQSVLPEVSNLVLNLTRDLELARSAYTQLLTRAQELRLVRASTVGNVRIVDGAQIGGSPVAPRKALVLGLSLILGAMTGLGLIFIRSWMRRGVQSAGDLEKLNFPVLATINYSLTSSHRNSRKGKLPILALESPENLTVEGIRSLRTGLHFGMLDAKSRTLAITSSAPGAGKTFVAANLAVVSAQAGQSVCLVDADLRRGKIHRYLGLSRDVPGLSDVLAGKVTWEDALHKGPVPGLYILPAGSIPPNPSELLMRHTLNDLIASLNERFQFTIFDCPPILAVTDPVIISRATGATVAVIRHNVTPVGEVIAAQKSLDTAGVKLDGTILNAFVHRKNQAGYDYNYRYSYTSR